MVTFFSNAAGVNVMEGHGDVFVSLTGITLNER